VSLIGTFAMFLVLGFSINLLTLFAMILSVLLSAFVALSLTPALCVMLLRPRQQGRGPLAWLLRKFDLAFGKTTEAYARANTWIIRAAPLAVLFLCAIYAGTAWLAKTPPTAFLPDEDLGYAIVAVQLPDAMALDRTEATMRKADALIRAIRGVANTVELSGFGLISGANTSNVGMFFVTLKPWEERQSPAQSNVAIIDAGWDHVSSSGATPRYQESGKQCYV
jgi:multidrug efflux pump subunit AcrB